MSISERAAHVLSTWLVVALATTAAGWAAAEQNGIHCALQKHSFATVTSLTCCCHPSPVTPDTARLPEVAPPQVTICPGSLMEYLAPAVNAHDAWDDVTSRHEL